jgi:hypothetical protein
MPQNKGQRFGLDAVVLDHQYPSRRMSHAILPWRF